MRSRLVLPACALAIMAALGPAAGHVAPAVGDNNRFLKLGVLGDRLRLAYTIFYGERPGRTLRGELDADHDGAITDAETAPFGERIAREVAAAVALEVDGAPRPIAWQQVVVGMGTPSASAGAFSIDLIASICVAFPPGPHTVVLRDHYALDRPGDTEVAAEDNPGVAIRHSAIGGAQDEAHDYHLVGPSGALATHGLELRLAANPRAVATPDEVCPAPARPLPLPAIAGGGAAVLAAAIALLVLRRRRQPSRKPR